MQRYLRSVPSNVACSHFKPSPRCDITTLANFSHDEVNGVLGLS